MHTVFLTNATGYPVLSKKHQHLMRLLFQHNVDVAISGRPRARELSVCWRERGREGGREGERDRGGKRDKERGREREREREREMERERARSPPGQAAPILGVIIFYN